jgi:hypothetical protein
MHHDVGTGSPIVMEFGVREEGSGNPLRVPIVVVVDGHDGAGPALHGPRPSLAFCG